MCSSLLPDRLPSSSSTKSQSLHLSHSSVIIGAFSLCRAATTRDTRWWSTRWSTTFTSSPAASSTPRSLPSLVCNTHTQTHSRVGSAAHRRAAEAVPHTPSLALCFAHTVDRGGVYPAARHLSHSRASIVTTTAACGFIPHHMHLSAANSLADGVVFIISNHETPHTCV